MGFKLKRGATLPDPRWISFVSLGVGDDHTKRFPIPSPDELKFLAEATGSFACVGQHRVNRKIVETIETDGKKTEVTKQVKGQVVRNDDGLPVAVELEEPAGEGVPVTLVVFDVKDPEGSFAVYPMTKGTKVVVDAATKVEKDRLKIKEKDNLPGDVWYRALFLTLVADWNGVTDEEGEKIPCTDSAKDSFLAAFDGFNIGFFVMEASSAMGTDLAHHRRAALGD